MRVLEGVKGADVTHTHTHTHTNTHLPLVHHHHALDLPLQHAGLDSGSERHRLVRVDPLGPRLHAFEWRRGKRRAVDGLRQGQRKRESMGKGIALTGVWV